MTLGSINLAGAFPHWEEGEIGSPDRVPEAQALPARLGKLGGRGTTHSPPMLYWEALRGGKRSRAWGAFPPPPPVMHCRGHGT